MWGIPRIELETSRTLSENHDTNPNALADNINKYVIISERNANIFRRSLKGWAFGELNLGPLAHK